MYYFFVISFVFGCFSSENQPETILENLHESQTPCSTLIEGKTVPQDITKGACAEGKTVHITITRDCPNNTQIYTNTLGWWSNDGIFHKGVAPEDIIKDCQWK